MKDPLLDIEGNIAVITCAVNIFERFYGDLVSTKIEEAKMQQAKHFILDMSKVSWMNSSGLGTVIGTLMQLKNDGLELHLAGVTNKISNLLVITRLSKIFDCYENVADAKKAIIKKDAF